MSLMELWLQLPVILKRNFSDLIINTVDHFWNYSLAFLQSFCFFLSLSKYSLLPRWFPFQVPAVFSDSGPGSLFFLLVCFSWMMRSLQLQTSLAAS